MIWIVGRGGLLGAALERAVGRDREGASLGGTWRPAASYRWADVDATRAALRRDAAAFVAEAGAAPWHVAWCAGRGVIGSTDEDMASEWGLIDALLGGLGGASGGTVFFASSAGAIYGAGSGGVVDESSPVSPMTAYGRGKLDHEARLARWAVDRGVALRIGRITTLVGPGQSLDKGQGLVSHMARSVRTRTPLHVYVPLATSRNYLHADDAGRITARWLAGTTRTAADSSHVRAVSGVPDVRMKIIAAPRSHSVATLVRTLSDVTRRRPLIATAARRGSAAQAGLSTYRSVVDLESDRIPTVPLPVMVREVVDAVGASRPDQGSRSSITR